MPKMPTDLPYGSNSVPIWIALMVDSKPSHHHSWRTIRALLLLILSLLGKRSGHQGLALAARASFHCSQRNSSWVFAASVRYGRSNGQRNIHQTAKNGPQYVHFGYNGPYAHIDRPPSSPVPFVANFLAVAEKQSESHAVIDFQAGRDFGLGLFGREGTSVLNAGIRFAQFATRMQSNIQARPDLKFVEFNIHTPYHPHNYGTEYGHHYHQYLATAQSARSFRGIGPSLSWNAAAPIVGNPEGGQLSVDWGANAAILFGRQKAKVQHKTSAVYFASNYAHLKYPNGLPGASYQHPEVNNQRARSVTVPNVGGFAGVMFSFTNFKASVGYRGDFFFDAMDTGFIFGKAFHHRILWSVCHR